MKLLAPFVVIAIALGAVIWFDDTPPDADLVFVNQNEVFTLDPQRMSYLQDLRLAHALYEGLVRWNNRNYEILPAVASALPVRSPDGRTYTFTLRPDAKWSNGDPVTAFDFMYAWQRAMLPDTAADYSGLFFAIQGAQDFFRWRTDQTAAFTAKPWSNPTFSGVHGVARRLRALLAADALPPELVARLTIDRDALAKELDRLEAASDGQPELEAALHAAPLAHLLCETLEEPDARRAEARWMWDEAQRRFSATVGLEALDDHTLRVTLRQPTGYFLDLLCFGVFFPVHRPTVEGWPETDASRAAWHTREPPAFSDRRWVRLSATTGKLEQKHQWAKADRHVGNGPYVLAQWRYKRDLRLELNPFYHDPDRVQSKSILVLTIEDTNTAGLAFESGHVDWLADVSAEYKADMVAERLAYDKRYEDELRALLDQGLQEDEALAQLPPPEEGERRNIHVIPTFGTDFYSFNCRKTLSDGRPNPFHDPQVRRAFVQSVDKEVIVKHVTRLNEPVAKTLIPPGSIKDYVSPAGLAHDPDAARRELEEAGWADRDGDGLVENARGEPFPVVHLLYTTNIQRYKWISLNLKSQWERELGVRIELESKDTKFYKEDLKLGKFMIARGRWYGDYGDPTTFLELCRTTDGNNDRKYSNPLVDALLDKAAMQTDRIERMKTLAQCERIICEEDVPLLVLCQLVQVYMYEPGRVTGLSHHPRLNQFLWQIGVNEP